MIEALTQPMAASYGFLVETYATERLKVLSTWSEFQNEDLGHRPHPVESKGRSVLEHMVHQCVSENLWFTGMFDIDVNAPPLPEQETRLSFIERYAEDSGRRLEALESRNTNSWWEHEVPFFETLRSRAWIMVRRIAHTAHHRGQQTTILRQLGHLVYSNYGPTADTGGLMQNRAPTIYPYGRVSDLIAGEKVGGTKNPLPEQGEQPLTERPSPS